MFEASFDYLSILIKQQNNPIYFKSNNQKHIRKKNQFISNRIRNQIQFSGIIGIVSGFSLYLRLIYSSSISPFLVHPAGSSEQSEQPQLQSHIHTTLPLQYRAPYLHSTFVSAFTSSCLIFSDSKIISKQIRIIRSIKQKRPQ